MSAFVIALVAFLIYIDLFCLCAKKYYNIKKSNHYSDDVTESKRVIKKHDAVKGILIYFYSLSSDIVFVVSKLVGFIPIHFVRMIFYKYVFHMNIDKKVVIYSGLEVRAPWNITIGKGTIIGDKAVLDAREGIEIGSNVNLSTGVWIWTLQHNINSSLFSSGGGIVIVEDRAWISSRTTILPGCTVKEGCVIAAGAVLTKSTEHEFCVYGGIPARCISSRNKMLDYEFTGHHRRFL